MEAQGMMARKTLIDATIIEAPRGRGREKEGAFRIGSCAVETSISLIFRAGSGKRSRSLGH